MEETIELEEGEACYYMDDDNNINLDSLSYIDERIQHVLGHFQKDFEGGVSAENLGAKFGGYGSFLPTHERSPPFRSQPKTPQRNYSSPRSPNNSHIEASSHTSRPPSNAPTSRLGTASHNANSFHNLKVLSFDNSMKQDVGLPSNLVAERCLLKHDNKSDNSTDQRTLKLRIKVNSDYLAQKNAAIYSNLGLGNSPSSSMGNSPEGSGGMPPVSQETAEESPSGIIQVMTSFPIPGGVLVSPLHDSLLYLKRKEKVLGDNRSVSSLNGHQEYCSMSTDESDSFVGNDQLSKRKVRIVNKRERQLELKHMSSNGVENDMTVRIKNWVGNRTPDHREFLSNDLKCTPLSSSVCDAGEIAEATGKASEILKGFNKETVKGKMVSIEAMKEESLESISCQNLDKSEKQHTENGFGEKVLENKQATSNKDKSMNNKKCKAYMTSEKAKGGVIKYKVDQDPQKHVISEKKKPLLGGKSKLEADHSPSNALTVAKKDNSGAVNNALITDKRSAGFGVSYGSSKMNKMKLLKDKVSDSNKNSSKGKGLELVVHGIDPIDRPRGHWPIINDKLDNFEEHSAYGVKVNEKPSANKMRNHIVGPCVKDSSNAFPVAENNSAVEMVPAATAAPLLIEEHWVCCDSCQKWRLLPLGTKPEQLPEKWLCSMLNWLPGMNICDINEEETTKALRALYQVPISDGQNNMQHQAAETAVVVSSSSALQSGLNHQNLSSDIMSDQRKKKLDIKEKTKAGSSSDPFLVSISIKKGPQDSVKNKSVTDMDPHHTDSNPMKKTSSQHPRKLHNLVAEEHVAIENDKQLSGGNWKHIKLKRKMEVDQYKCATPKKSKIQDMYYADKHPSMDLEKVSSNSRNCLLAKVAGKDMRKYDENCLSENARDKLVVPVNNEGVQAQVLPDGGSLDVTNNSTKDSSVKKRKLKDRQDNDNHGDTFSLQDDGISGSRKEKKYKVLSKEGTSVIGGDHKLNRKGKVSQVYFSGGRDHVTVDSEVRSADKDQELRKHRKNISSQQALDGIDPLGRDLGSGQPSLAATSSSSKVSGSHKARTNTEDVKNSPVGSVTSSPLRTSYLDKLILVGDTSQKDDGIKGGFSSLSSKNCLDNSEEKQSVKMKEKVSVDLHPESRKLSSIKYRVGDANNNCRVKSKTSCEVNDDHLLNGGVSSVQQLGYSANGTHLGDRMKNKQESELVGQKSGAGILSLQGTVKDRRSGSEFDRNAMKVSFTENGYSRNGGSYELAVDTNGHAPCHETINDAKSKCESDHIRKKNFVRHQSSENGKQTEPKQKDFENSILKEDASCTTDRKRLCQQSLTQDFDGENKADPDHVISRDGLLKVFPPLDSKRKMETLSVDSRSAPGSQKEDMSNGHLVHAPGNGDAARLMKCSLDASSKGDVNRCSGKFESDRQPTVSSPLRTSSSQNAFKILKEATKLKDTADHYKNSGFEFESNETYFKAALNFLHGVSLLENCHSDSVKRGEMSQMQTYATTSKLFESCAHEYERHQEMAAAALAYKCMEVAYMRVVYCKSSSTNRDRHELQSTLQLITQGESPSSSASDVDNLNNQAAGVKVTLPRGTSNHVTGNQVISARNRSNFVRLLDFTQDVNLAMEASRKCQITFVAAMEEARNKDCITSVRKVIDFSFQDVDELVRLVWCATKAISCAGLGGARE